MNRTAPFSRNGRFLRNRAFSRSGAEVDADSFSRSGTEVNTDPLSRNVTEMVVDPLSRNVSDISIDPISRNVSDINTDPLSRNVSDISIDPISSRPDFNLTRGETVEEFLKRKVQEENQQAENQATNPSVFSFLTGVSSTNLLFCIPLILCSWLIVLGLILPYFKRRASHPSSNGTSKLLFKEVYLLFILAQCLMIFLNMFLLDSSISLALHFFQISNVTFLILDLLYTNLVLRDCLAQFRGFDGGRFDPVNDLFHLIWFTSPFILTFATAFGTVVSLYFYYFLIASLSFLGDILCLKAFQMTINSFQMTVNSRSPRGFPKLFLWFLVGCFIYFLGLFIRYTFDLSEDFGKDSSEDSSNLSDSYKDSKKDPSYFIIESLICASTTLIWSVQLKFNILRHNWYKSRRVDDDEDSRGEWEDNSRDDDRGILEMAREILIGIRR